MSISVNTFNIGNNKEKKICIKGFTKLTGDEAKAIRQAVTDNVSNNYASIYIDASEVNEADLSGINEIIHTNYYLQSTPTQLVFAYRKNSVIEKWMEITSLGRFVATAILPAH